jgi:hypothetical protein
MIRLHPARGGGTNWTGQRLACSPLSMMELVLDEGSSIRSRPTGLQDAPAPTHRTFRPCRLVTTHLNGNQVYCGLWSAGFSLGLA